VAAEPAGPVSAPTTPSPEGKLSSGGRPGTPGPAGSPPVGVFLRYPSGLAGPTEFDTQVRGQKLPPTPDIDTSHTTINLVLSGSGVPGPNAGTLAAAEGPSPAAQQQFQSLQSHATLGDLTQVIARRIYVRARKDPQSSQV